MAGIWFLSFLFAALALNCHCQEKKVHIVYLGGLPKAGPSPALLHHSMLKDVLGSSARAKESLVYSYGRSFNGFAAKLSDDEAVKFKERDEVVSVFPNNKYTLHTTRSWDFIGFPQDHLHSQHESNVIVGVVDSGIWPESASFSDKGFGPPPAKWKGKCQTAGNITCNKKLIGARFYHSGSTFHPRDIKSPRDAEGHGTHTASTATGRTVSGASFYGLGEGVARGAVPQARVAVYKVCWSDGCYTADILAAFNDAIADGVDIISVSLGAPYAYNYFQDAVAIGAFHAMKKGILTSNSAGNNGPFPYSISNCSPWSLSVAASFIDRSFVSKVVLGDGQVLTGNAINTYELNGTSLPLIDGGAAPNVSFGASKYLSSYCNPESLDSYKIKGKIVMCNEIGDGSAVASADGLGSIMNSEQYGDMIFSYPIPATVVSNEDGNIVRNYMQSTDNPTATILASETWKDIEAPRVPDFSSRGPNPVSPDILKPDLTAPGVSILAAWSPLGSPSGTNVDTRSVKYNIISGTSMSCPHATGAAAYIKSFYPNWSPAAIKSALMTTAFVMDDRRNEEAEFAYGSGQINPTAAIHPGLVYDASEKDYVDMLCKQDYSTAQLQIVTGDSSSCSGISPGKTWDLNYPSFALSIPDGQPISGTFKRTVTNVGLANSTYHVNVSMPSPVKVTVEPSVLSFSSVGEKKSFTVKVTGGVIFQQRIISGYISWKDGVHTVRSPLVVYNKVTAFFVGSSSKRSMSPKNGRLGN
ncbi:cucumisin-like protein [Cinnamomum micranthum f. kanehirae]|uniref:Cucumisin-like protein n=1 Tax=Cinnamomum micranthum f. kanehirae TaxID=337451 RepID=A0A443N0C1_9MAGN|nr:cucumisin-like protein [Cinnamomum micranthum f. kanehirae]